MIRSIDLNNYSQQNRNIWNNRFNQLCHLNTILKFMNSLPGIFYTLDIHDNYKYL